MCPFVPSVYNCVNVLSVLIDLNSAFTLAFKITLPAVDSIETLADCE